MEYFQNPQNSWGYVDQQQQQQAPQPASEWAPVPAAAADASDPFAPLDHPNQMFYPGLQTLSSPPPGYPPQQQFYPMFSSWYAQPINDAPDPAAPTARLQPGQQQHVQQLQSNGTIDPSLMQNYNMQFMAQAPSAYPVSVNPSLLQQQQQQPPQPPEVKPTLAEALVPFLASKALESGSRGAVNSIVDTIDKHGGPADVEASVRRELMSRIRDNAGPDFLKAWVSHHGAMEIVRSWLKAGITGGGTSTDESNNALIALLYVIHRLPLTVDLLRESKIGRYIKHLQKSTTTTSAIKSVADQLEKNWLNIVMRAESDGTPEATGSSDDTRNRKRKIPDSESSRDGPPYKKSGSGSTKVVVKKETKSGTSTSVTHAKSDSSFFSAPKPKPKLPSFKKGLVPTPPATVGVKQEPVAQTISNTINPFQDAMKSLNKGRSGSPSPGTPPSTAVPSAASSLTDPNKKSKKRVHFPPESHLRQIRIVTRVVYDDDPTDGGETTHNVRDLDRAEGAAMHQSLFQEVIDWFEPPPVLIPQHLFDGSTWPYVERGKLSEQKILQEVREQTSLASMYQSPEDIPPCPAEPPAVSDEPEGEPLILVCGSELDALSAAPPSPPPQAQVSDLLSRLNPNANVAAPSAIIPQTMASVPEAPVAATFAADPQALLGPDSLSSLQHILASLTPPAPTTATTPIPPAASIPQTTASFQSLSIQAYPGWPAQQTSQLPQPTMPQLDAATANPWGTSSSQSQDDRRTWTSDAGWRGGASDRGSARGRGARGAWRGKRKPCNFFAQGKCRYGDQCDFLHERE